MSSRRASSEVSRGFSGLAHHEAKVDIPTTTQAQLLKGRGDLRKARLCFQAKLSGTATVQKASCMDRLGFGIEPSNHGHGLKVSTVADEFKARDTPTVEYNIRQERRRQPLYKITPGDKIKAVNGSSATPVSMLKELVRASNSETTGGLRLVLERQLSDVLTLASPTKGRSGRCLPRSTSSEELPEELPEELEESEPLPAIPTAKSCPATRYSPESKACSAEFGPTDMAYSWAAPMKARRTASEVSTRECTPASSRRPSVAEGTR